MVSVKEIELAKAELRAIRNGRETWAAANAETASVERATVVKREVKNENAFKKYSIGVKSERETLAKDEEMDVVFDEPDDQDDHKRVPLGNLNNRYSLSQPTRSQNSLDSDCLAID